MRRIVLSLAAAGAAFVAASPAIAQYYPAPQPGPYGYHGYDRFGSIRVFQTRIDNIERQINRLDRRDAIRGRSADRLRDEAVHVENRLRDKARGGLSPREANDIEIRIQRLEQRVQFALNDRYGRYDRW